MSIDELMKDPAFQKLDPERIVLLKQMCAELQGKNQMEQMSILVKYNKTLSAGKKITKEERQLMIEVLLQGLSEQERSNFRNILKSLGHL